MKIKRSISIDLLTVWAKLPFLNNFSELSSPVCDLDFLNKFLMMTETYP